FTAIESGVPFAPLQQHNAHAGAGKFLGDDTAASACSHHNRVDLLQWHCNACAVTWRARRISSGRVPEDKRVRPSSNLRVLGCRRVADLRKSPASYATAPSQRTGW